MNYDPGLNLKKRWFGKPDPAVSLQIREAIHAVLASEPQITNIRWCNEAETDCGSNPA